MFEDAYFLVMLVEMLSVTNILACYTVILVTREGSLKSKGFTYESESLLDEYILFVDLKLTAVRFYRDGEATGWWWRWWWWGGGGGLGGMG